MRAVTVDDRPRLVMFALKDIAKGQELLYDYDKRSKEVVAAHP